MSQQAGSPEEMGGWSGDTARRELPGLLSRLQSSGSGREAARLFHQLAEALLPHLSLSEAEEKLLSQALPTAVQGFGALVGEATSLATELSSQNLELRTSLRSTLQNMVDWLEALMACMRSVCHTEEPVALETVRSLPSAVLRILLAAFTHCKESDSVYGHRLHLVSDLLQAIFKDAVGLQKQLMELLDRTVVSGASGQSDDMMGMASLLHAFLDICAVVSKMDHALHANTWKFIIKQAVKHKVSVENQLRHHDIVRALCDDILLSFQSCLEIAKQMSGAEGKENADQRQFQKTLKLCRFFATSLLHYIKEFMAFLSGMCVLLHHLYLQIYSLLPPSLYAVSITDVHKQEMSQVFLAALDPVLVQLIVFKPFVDSVLNEYQEIPREQQFPHCLLLINVVDKLSTLPEDVQVLWCSSCSSSEEKPRSSVFKAVFQSFAVCSPETSLPLTLRETVVKGQEAVNMTFYQYTCIHLCAYIMSLPLACFSELERSLLNAVISSRVMESLLATDVWCFLARYGTTELCAEHVRVIASLVKSCPGSSFQLSNLVILLRRLLFLMDVDHQESFIKMFPPEIPENLSLWQHVSLSSLPSALVSQVKNSLFKTALLHCKRWLNGKQILGDLHQLNTSLSALLVACHSPGKIMDGEHLSELNTIFAQLLPLFRQKQLLATQPFLQETFCLFLNLFSYTLRTVDPAMLTEVMSLISSACQLDSPANIKLTVLDFLCLLGRILIPQAAQMTTLPKVAGLFSMLLSDTTWVVNQYALETFTQFAEETSYEEVVPQCLKSEEIKDKVIGFLNKAVLATETDSRRKERLEKEGTVLEDFFTKSSEECKVNHCSEPPKKKARPDSMCREEDYKTHVQSAEKSLLSLQSLLKESSVPEWLADRLGSLQSLLTKLQHNCKPTDVG
ncbi:FIGNL1-interacting regulator of recombination and mitosis-like [Hyperolius riggenbachi]|uniref:FIGNL1-interacting regulator of recombination and mitosis-like n=1 Tax=Hyperolius riggenbachi TaxID=752182 RepID=UPI0035A2AC23